MKTGMASIECSTTSGCDVIDISDEVIRLVAKTGIEEGIALLHVAGSTASITTIEYESGVVQDFKDALDRLAPRDIRYRHDARWGDGNGYSHVRASLLGPSLALPVEGGRMVLGTWQQVVLVDMDNRPRRRRVLLRVVGV